MGMRYVKIQVRSRGRAEVQTDLMCDGRELVEIQGALSGDVAIN